MSPGSLIAAAGLDSHETVLHDVHAADGIASTNFVQQLDQLDRLHLHAIDGNWNSLLEADLDLLFPIRSFLRRTGNLPGGVERRIARVFQLTAFVADVPQVSVTAVNLGAARGHGD